MLNFLAATEPVGMGVGGTLLYWVVLIAVFGLMFYFVGIRPQKKQQKKQDELMASLAIGDSVLTTAGFYGVVIDVMDEVIIVEFGNNKNCRIPMQKRSVVEVEKPVEEEAKAK
ncbi:MAG: preprotein translocase subunit YajC [Lachnospiraceae bacterium]|nr:preprotein translocase subunit YajC [Lachnospiraceae bacterium]